MRSRLISRRGLATVAVSVVSVIGCCLLAWWQWTRFESASGTLQNLGYVLQWPLFGVFPTFMFWRIHQAGRAEQAAGSTADGGGIANADRIPDGLPVPSQWISRVDDGAGTSLSLPQWTDQRAYVQNRAARDAADEDYELLAYNRYLAQLSAQQEDHHAG